jgi:hypothetical protein
VKKAEVDSGKRSGVPSDVADRLKAVERENRELRQANEIPRKASNDQRPLQKVGESGKMSGASRLRLSETTASSTP